MTASRIRVALTGLSAEAATTSYWVEDAHLEYLLSPLGRERYAVVALLLEAGAGSAQGIRARLGLPDSVRTYVDPSELGAAADVDLVVCCARADGRARAVVPSLRAGKAVFVEWPVAESLDAAMGLASEYGTGDGGGGSSSSISSGCSTPSLAAAAGANGNIVGLQSRLSPVVAKVREILDSMRVGRVLSSDVCAFGSRDARDALAPDRAHFAAARARGENAVTLALGHTLDYVHHVLGEFEPGTMRCRMQLQRPELRVAKGGGGGGPDGAAAASDVPDLVVVHGRLAAASHYAAADATLSVAYRTGPPFKGEPGLVWTINCERAEIMVTSPSGPYLTADAEPEHITIRVHDFASDQVTNVHWDWEEWQLALPPRARNVAQLYERFGRWWAKMALVGEAGPWEFRDHETMTVSEDDDWPRIRDGILRMKELDAMFRQYDRQGRV